MTVSRRRQFAGSVLFFLLAADQEVNKKSHEYYKRAAHTPKHIHDHQTVFPCRGIVMEAKQQNLIGRASDLVIRSLDKAEAQVPLLKRDAIKVPREEPFGSGDHNAARVRPLIRNLIPVVVKTDRLGELMNLRIFSGEEVKSVGGGRIAKFLDVTRLLRRSEFWRLFRFEADRHELVVLTRHKRDLLQRTDKPIQFEIAQHRALVIYERQDYRLPLKITAQTHILSGLILKSQIQGKLA